MSLSPLRSSLLFVRSVVFSNDRPALRSAVLATSCLAVVPCLLAQGGLGSPPPSLEPEITILFAGSHGGQGGPFWRPPGETVELEPSNEGYYVDDTRQLEDWIEIDLEVEDPDHPGDPTAVQSVKLKWLATQDRNFPPFVLGEFDFVRGAGLSWSIRTDQLITPIVTQEGTYYSFDVVAEDVDGESATVGWMKTAPHTTPTNPIESRRFVQLNCAPVDPSYRPYYLRIGDFDLITADDRSTHDRYQHDTGPEQGYFDTGVLLPEPPGFAVEQRWCQHVMAHWFGESICVENFTLENIYFHNWLSTQVPESNIVIGWAKTRTHADFSGWIDFFEWSHADGRSFIEYDGHPETSSDYSLMTGLMDTVDTTFTDNTINELMIFGLQFPYIPSSIGSRRVLSFVILNVPEISVLENLDSDGDNLTDDQELYETFTSPFLADTDNDGISDGFEVSQGSDPNNYRHPKPDPHPLPVEEQ